MPDSYICSGAMMQCTMGTSPAKLTVLPSRTVYLAGQPQANISDHKSMVNLGPFGLCRSLGYPATASATAAALGHLTPMPCMHNTPSPWMGGKTDHLVKGQPALLTSSKCTCMWGGIISLLNNGQVGEGAQGVEVPPVAPPIKREKIDNLILCDAYWKKEKNIIRLIPYQMEVSLIVVFVFEHNNDDYNRDKAIFELSFDAPETIFSQQEPIIIKGADVLPLYDDFNNRIKDNDRPCYYYKIDRFSSDFSHIYP